MSFRCYFRQNKQRAPQEARELFFWSDRRSAARQEREVLRVERVVVLLDGARVHQRVLQDVHDR